MAQNKLHPLLRRLVDECNKVIWNYLHPPGFPLPPGCEQHRDEIRLFFIGAYYTLFCLSKHTDQEMVEAFDQFMESISARGWRPDHRFYPPPTKRNPNDERETEEKR